MPPVQVGVVMGSSSDWDTLQHAVQILHEFGVAHEARVVSAHRMPDDMFAYAEQAAGRGLQAIIAGAGGAAHLPGMLAAKTTVPVLGVPVASRHLQGVDSLHSIVQMPKGIPVATFAIGAAGAANAALFAVAMLANDDAALRGQLVAFRARQTEAARAMTELPPRGMTAPARRRCRRAHAGRDGRRPAGPHVRARGAGAWATAPRCSTPTPASPAGRVATSMCARAYDDAAGPGAAGAHARRPSPPSSRTCRPQALDGLAAQRPVAPGAAAVAIARTARGEGAFPALRRALRAVCGDRSDARPAGGAATTLLPGILKTARLGYDGKGQVRVADRAGAARPPGTSCGACPACWSSCCRWRPRCSVIVARGADGAMVHLPVQQNLHRDGILAVTEVPAPGVLPDATRAAGDRGHPRDRRRAWTTSACCASSSSCCRTARWWSTRWRRARTTAATTASTPATSRSSSCRCARWPACRWWRRASTAPR